MLKQWGIERYKNFSRAMTGLTSGLDAPLARRYRSLEGKMKKKTLFLSALLLVVLALEGVQRLAA
jgi:hypothetical protein